MTEGPQHGLEGPTLLDALAELAPPARSLTLVVDAAGTALDACLEAATRELGVGEVLVVRVPNRRGRLGQVVARLRRHGLTVLTIKANLRIGASTPALLPADSTRILRFFLRIRFPRASARHRLLRAVLGWLEPRWLARDFLVTGRKD